MPFQPSSTGVLILTPSPEEYEALAASVVAADGVFRCPTANGTELVRIAATGRGETEAEASTRAFLKRSIPPMIILSGIAGARHDADFGPFDCILATSCFDYSVVEHRPDQSHLPSWEPYGPSTSDAPLLKASLLEWNAVLRTTIDLELEGLGAQPPSRDAVIEEEITARDPQLRQAIKAALMKHAQRKERLFIPSLVCSGDKLEKDADLFQAVTGWNKRLWAVEMEFAGVARACSETGIPCFMIRAISDMVGYRKQPDWTGYAARVAAAAVKSLFLHQGFWDWIAGVHRSERRRATVRIGGRAAAIAADAVDQVEMLAPFDPPVPDKRAQARVLDPGALSAASKIAAGGILQGDLPLHPISQRLGRITEVCSGCAFGVRRARLLRPIMESISQTSALQEEHQLRILVNTVRLAIIEGNFDQAKQFHARLESAPVQEFFKALSPERLREFLQAGLELNGIESEDGRLFMALIQSQELPVGTLAASGAARCLACKAVAARHAAADDWIELARRYGAALSEEIDRRDANRGVEAIAVYHDILRQTGGDWNRVRGDMSVKRRLDAVRQLPDGRWPLRHAEAALFASLGFVASGEPDEANQAKNHLAVLELRGKVTHCLFDLPALRVLVESWDRDE